MFLQLKAFFQLIRWPNLLMLVFTQMMLNYLVIGHMFKLINLDLPLAQSNFVLLVISTVFMAAYGYIHNDVVDEEVDTINKEEKRIIGKQISRKSALFAGRVFLVFSLAIAAFLSWKLHMFQLVLLHILIAGGLWYYSIQLKKTILSGNIIISLFTATSVFIVWLYHLVVIKNDPILMVDAQKITRFVTQTVVIYSIFAFIISMIREIVKDIEDKEGDEKTGTKTMIIQWGLQKTKAVIYFLIISMMSILVFTIFHVHTYQWTQLAIYLGVAVGIPLIYFLINLIKAENKKDFKDLSLLAKIIMIAGILSMQLFYISYGS